VAATCTSEQEEYKRNFKRTGQATLECASNVLQAMFLVWILYRFMVFKQVITMPTTKRKLQQVSKIAYK